MAPAVQGCRGHSQEYWDGSTWTVQSVPGHPASPSTGMAGVSCVSRSDCTATGSYLTQNHRIVAVAFRYSHGTWQLRATAGPAGRKALSGISCSSVSTCTAVGGYTLSPSQPLAEQR